MTTPREMALANHEQARIVAALERAGEHHVAARLRRCSEARSGRRYDSGWPWTCRSIGCAWCRHPIIRGWWAGMLAWRSPHALILVIIPLTWQAGHMRIAVRRLRRALRDFRDRRARHSKRWRGVCLCGLVTGDRIAMVVVDRGAVDRRELTYAMQRRWANASVADLTDEQPSAEITITDAVELATLRRGAEPLRLVIPPQRNVVSRAMPIIEPMPILV
jgi:hypothetical protein